VVHGQSSFIEVDDLAFSHEHQSIKHLEDVGVGLMDCLNDGSSLLGKIFQSLHHRGCCERVKTCGRLIQENKIWVSNKLDTDGCSLSLTT